jgi:hypothetical protein
VVIPAECIIYNGTFLEEFGVNPGDSLADILNLISQFLCICTTTTTSTTSTTTTSTTSTSTTSTTTSTSTTTTTTVNPNCTAYYILNLGATTQDYQYDDCFGVQTPGTLAAGECIEVEAIPGTFVLGNDLVSGEGPCPMALKMVVQNFVGFDPTSLNDWIINLQIPSLVHLRLVGTTTDFTVYLYSSSTYAFSLGTALDPGSFGNLIEFDDIDGCITSLSNGGFDSQPLFMTYVNLPAATSIDDFSFRLCDALTTILLPSVTSLGTTTGNNNVFTSISGNTINLTIPSALMTCNAGNPDGDIVALQGANTVTITQV